MTKFDKWLANSKWVILPAMYVILCVWTYFGSTVTIEGVTLPQHEAGVYGVVGLHVMGFIALVGGYALHWITELISRLWQRKK